MKRKSQPKNSFWDAIPEIDQHEVRYAGNWFFNYIQI